MDDKERNSRLHAICDRVYAAPHLAALGFGREYSPPFDISKPNKHDTKGEFLTELAIVEKLSAEFESLLGTLRAAFKDDHPQRGAVRAIKNVVDANVRERLSNRAVEHPIDVAVDVAARVGTTATTAFLVFEWLDALSSRKLELKLQEQEFWSGKGRAPDHYARIIALRFAKEVARHTGKKPTFGTSSYGDNPSTEFGRALDEIFDVLGIKTNFRHPAIWAIDQLTDEDLKPPSYNAGSGLFGAPSLHPGNALRGLLDIDAEMPEE